MIELHGVSKVYPTRKKGAVTALAGLDLRIEGGEFITLVGPSGCGKSTVLKLVSGLLAPSAGRVTIGGQTVSGPRREMGFVFQTPVLLPWRTVRENVLLPIEMLGRPVGPHRARADELLEQVGLADFRAAHPGVAIHMVEDTQDDVLAALRADELDCAFTALDPDALGNEFAATLLWEEEIVVALPVSHALCARRRVTFEELATEDLIAYRENSAMRRRLERAMADRGLEPRNAFICTEMAAVRGLASKGLGVAVIPRSVAEQPGPPIELRPIGEGLTWPVALVWRAARRQTPAGKAFLKVAIEHAERAERPELRAA